MKKRKAISESEERKQRDVERKRLMRSRESPNSKNERKKRDAMWKKQARSLESIQEKEARNMKNVANMRLKRSLDLTLLVPGRGGIRPSASKSLITKIHLIRFFCNW